MRAAPVTRHPMDIFATRGGDQGPPGSQGPPGTGLEIKGSVPEVGDLPAEAEPGDVWVVREFDPDHLFMWDGDSWVDLGEGGSSSTGAAHYPSRAAASAASIPVMESAIETMGYAAPGDGGGATYKRVVSEPTHEGKFQSVDGAWWEYVVEGPIRVEQFGGVADSDTLGTPATDNYQPFMDALSLANNATVVGGSTLTNIMPKLEFRVGNYYFSQTLDIRARVWLLGQSTGQWTRNGGTCFHFPADTTGIRFQQINTDGHDGPSTAPTYAGTSGGSICEGITVVQSGTDLTKHGFHLRTNATLKNCYSYDAPGNAFAIIGQSGSATIEGNCNSWVMDTCQAAGFGGHGLFISGGDTNGGRNYNFTTSGIAGDYGCGIYDSSSYSCVHVTPQITGYGNCGVHYAGIRYYLISATAGIGAATTPGTDYSVWAAWVVGGVAPGRFEEWSGAGTYKLQLPVFIDGGSSTFVSPYVEGGGPVHVPSPGLVIGGENSPTSTTPTLKPTSSPLGAVLSRTGVGAKRTFVAGTPGYTNNGSQVWVGLGTVVHPDENLMNVLEHRREIDGAASYSYKYDGGDLTYGFFNAKLLWHISTTTTAVTYGRTLSVPHQISFSDYALRDPGSTANWRIHGIRAAIPTAAGEYARGELRWNSAPTAGGFAGWICTTGGALASPWVSGTNYSTLSYIKTAAGRFYKCSTDGGTSSTVEPTHTSGAVTEADGFGWTYLTATEAAWKTFGVISA